MLSQVTTVAPEISCTYFVLLEFFDVCCIDCPVFTEKGNRFVNCERQVLFPLIISWETRAFKPISREYESLDSLSLPRM